MIQRFDIKSVYDLFNKEMDYNEDILNLYYRIINLKNNKKESELTYIYFIKEYKI